MKHIYLLLLFTSSIYAGNGIPPFGSSFLYHICEQASENQLVFLGEEIDRYQYSCDAFHGDPPECDPPVLSIWIKYQIFEILVGEHVPQSHLLEFPPNESFEAVSSENEIWVRATSGVDETSGIFIVEGHQLITRPVLEYNDENDLFTGYVYDSTLESTDTVTLSEIHNLLESCQEISGIDNLAIDFDVFPNPANDVVFLPSDIQDGEVEIFDIRGRQVLRGETKRSIDVSNLATGRYFLRLKSNDGETFVSNFLIQN